MKRIALTSVVLNCAFVITACDWTGESSYADCILNHSDKMTNDAGTRAIEEACREKFPAESVGAIDSVQADNPYRLLTTDELEQVTILDRSYLANAAYERGLATILESRGTEVEWWITVKVKNGTDVSIEGLKLEIADRDNASLTWNEEISLALPAGALREVQITVPEFSSYIVTASAAVTYEK